MCWIGRKGEAIKRDAKRDIEVFKIIYKTINGRYKSYYWNFEYKKNEVNQGELRVANCSPEITNILSGFHSYKSLDMLNNRGINICVKPIKGSGETIDYVYSIYEKDKLIIAKFIIPKGSEYYENQNGEIVSNQIIFKEEVND